MQVKNGKGIGKNAKAEYHLIQFESLAEIAKYAHDNPTPGLSDRRGNSHYNVTESLQDAYELALHGWHDVRPQVDATLEPLREQLGKALATVTERAFDMTGFEPDIDRYIAGELECMIEDIFVPAPKDGKVFTLLVDASMTFDNEAKDILKRGAVLCALVDAYCLLGLQLEVWVESTVTGSECNHTKYGTILTKVNTAGDPIDVDALMFALGHGDYNRRLQWSVGEQDAFFRNKCGFLEGGYYGLNRNGAHMAEYVGASAAVTLDGNRDMTRDPLKWVLTQLVDQGVVDSEDVFS